MAVAQWFIQGGAKLSFNAKSLFTIDKKLTYQLQTKQKQHSIRDLILHHLVSLTLCFAQQTSMSGIYFFVTLGFNYNYTRIFIIQLFATKTNSLQYVGLHNNSMTSFTRIEQLVSLQNGDKRWIFVLYHTLQPTFKYTSKNKKLLPPIEGGYKGIKSAFPRN